MAKTEKDQQTIAHKPQHKKLRLSDTNPSKYWGSILGASEG